MLEVVTLRKVIGCPDVQGLVKASLLPKIQTGRAETDDGVYTVT